MTALRFFDVVLVVVAAPIMLLIGVPATGYLVGGGVWIALRAVGELVDRYAGSVGGQAGELTLRMSYLLGRLFTLAIAVILVRQDASRNDGLTALVVIVFAFTAQLALSFVNRPRSR